MKTKFALPTIGTVYRKWALALAAGSATLLAVACAEWKSEGIPVDVSGASSSTPQYCPTSTLMFYSATPQGVNYVQVGNYSRLHPPKYPRPYPFPYYRPHTGNHYYVPRG
ncbi:MAG: hypothetical protein NTW86_21325 [Candidatus Sumerlaeota bacterium]|nr:hypothetical protein [Candidatus Sumerlaeota bacterium]